MNYKNVLIVSVIILAVLFIIVQTQNYSGVPASVIEDENSESLGGAASTLGDSQIKSGNIFTFLFEKIKNLFNGNGGLIVEDDDSSETPSYASGGIGSDGEIGETSVEQKKTPHGWGCYQSGSRCKSEMWDDEGGMCLIATERGAKTGSCQFVKKGEGLAKCECVADVAEE